MYTFTDSEDVAYALNKEFDSLTESIKFDLAIARLAHSLAKPW